MREPDFARMALAGKVGVIALSLAAGAALGFVGTFAHQSAPPMGVVLALVTVGLFVVGLRVWGGVRAPAAAASVGVGLVAGLLAGAGNGTVLIPANTAGYAWLGGITAIVFLALAWPHVQRPPRRTPDTMRENVREDPLGRDRRPS